MKKYIFFIVIILPMATIEKIMNLFKRKPKELSPEKKAKLEALLLDDGMGNRTTNMHIDWGPKGHKMTPDQRADVAIELLQNHHRRKDDPKPMTAEEMDEGITPRTIEEWQEYLDNLPKPNWLKRQKNKIIYLHSKWKSRKMTKYLRENMDELIKQAKAK